MLFANNVRAWFGPHIPFFPFQQLLDAWLACAFEPAASRRHAEAILAAYRVDPAALDLTELEHGGLLVPNDVLYPSGAHWQLEFTRHSEQNGRALAQHQFSLEEADVEAAAALVRTGCRSSDRGAFEAEFGHLGEEFSKSVLGRCDEPPRSAWPELRAPGIYRREHASLVICSETTRILVDPLSSFVPLPGLTALPPPRADEHVDAICISHTHADHWSLASVLAHASQPGVPVIVPRIEQRSILSPNDMRRELELCGQSVLDPQWGHSLSIGDIEVDILPFYGEQPTRDAPGPEASLRSWGNCYRFNTPDFSVLVLVDSGTDPSGCMLEVVSESKRRRGPVDVVTSCLREFASPFFGGLSTYWAVLPFERLRALFEQFRVGRLPSTTAGPAGVAEICAAAGARHYLPYAHGFRGVGQAIDDIGWGSGEPSEMAAAAAVSAALSALGCSTQAVNWTPGAVAHRDARGLSIRPS